MKSNHFRWVLASLLVLGSIGIYGGPKPKAPTACETALSRLESLAALGLEAGNETLNILVIDSGHPDVFHPDFQRSDGSSVVWPASLNPYFSEAPPTLDAEAMTRPMTRRARFTRWWYTNVLHGEIGKKVSKTLSPVRTLAYYLPTAATAFAAYEVLVNGNFDTYASFFNFLKSNWHYTITAPAMAELIKRGPLLASPTTVRRLNREGHATHVAGTLARGLRDSIDRLAIHTLNMHEVTGPYFGSDPYLPDPNQGHFTARLSRFLKNLHDRMMSHPHGPADGVSAEQEAADFLRVFFALNVDYVQRVIETVHNNNIRAVNMSYGISRLFAVESIQKVVERQFGINAAPGTALGEEIMELTKGLYAHLFQSCPDTAFFVAAGNDGSSINTGDAVIQSLEMPNVFISAAAQDSLARTSFTNFRGLRSDRPTTSAGNVDSAGLGHNRLSSRPGGGTAVMSGTSMASPENMLLYTYLIASNPELTVEQGLDLLRRGVVREESLRDEVASQGVTIPSAVYAEYLLHLAKTRDLLLDYELPPRLYVSPGRSQRLVSSLIEVSPRSREEPSYSALPHLGPLMIDPRSTDPREYTRLSTRVLEALLVSESLSTDPATVEAQARDALSRIDEAQMRAQARILKLFFTTPEIQDLEVRYQLPRAEERASFRELYDRHLRAKLREKKASLYELTWILEFVQQGGAPTLEDLETLKADLFESRVAPQYAKTVFIRISHLHPELRPAIHELFARSAE